MRVTRMPKDTPQHKSSPSMMPKASTFSHTIRDLRPTSREMEIAPSCGAVSGFFCCGSTGRSIVIGGAARLQSIGAVEGDMTNQGKPQASQPIREHHAGCSHPDIETSLVDKLVHINNRLVNGQRRLAKKHAALQRVSTKKSQILGMVAHDLRNPLNGILNASQYVLGDSVGLLGENDLKLLQGIESTSRFMLRLIDDMVEISAIESGRLLLDRKPTDILSLIEQILSLNRPMAERKRISIDVIAPIGLPSISIDSTKMYRVIDNLLTNAVKFSNPGDRVKVRVHAGDGLINIAVLDQGPGIPAHELKTVFNLFQKGRLASISETPGTGLGLAIAKRIVEAHGGKLQLKSKVGRGSTLTVSLPISTHIGQRGVHRAHRSAQSGPAIASSMA